MKIRVMIVTCFSLVLMACGGETRSDKRQEKGISLDVLAYKPVKFEFMLPDRSTLVSESPDITAKLTGFFYKIQGEGEACPESEVHEDAGSYDDGRLISLNVISACNYLVTIKIGNFQAPATAALTATTVNYQEHIQGLVQQNCVSCHASYASYAGVKDAAKAMVMAVENESMPPTAPLAGSEIALFLAWADSGFLENNPTASLPSPQEQSLNKVYYRNDNYDYIQSYELLGRTRYELQRSLWLQAEGQAEGLQTKQLYTFYGASSESE